MSGKYYSPQYGSQRHRIEAMRQGMRTFMSAYKGNDIDIDNICKQREIEQEQRNKDRELHWGLKLKLRGKI